MQAGDSMPRKSKKTRKRYTPAQKAKILAAAAKDNMTGKQAAKKFGISTRTFYRWRGPVRKDGLARTGKRAPGTPYTRAEKAKILAAAKKDGLTGPQVAKRFGISHQTFYNRLGPVRKDAIARRGRRGPGRPKGSGWVRVNEAVLRRAVQTEIRKMLPQIIREEVAAAIKGE